MRVKVGPERGRGLRNDNSRPLPKRHFSGGADIAPGSGIQKNCGAVRDTNPAAGYASFKYEGHIFGFGNPSRALRAS